MATQSTCTRRRSHHCIELVRILILVVHVDLKRIDGGELLAALGTVPLATLDLLLHAVDAE